MKTPRDLMRGYRTFKHFKRSQYSTRSILGAVSKRVRQQGMDFQVPAFMRQLPKAGGLPGAIAAFMLTQEDAKAGSSAAMGVLYRCVVSGKDYPSYRVAVYFPGEAGMDQPCKISCSCPAMNYWVGYANNKAGALNATPRVPGKSIPAPKNNPTNHAGCCKHVAKLISRLSLTELKGT